MIQNVKQNIFSKNRLFSNKKFLKQNTKHQAKLRILNLKQLMNLVICKSSLKVASLKKYLIM